MTHRILEMQVRSCHGIYDLVPDVGIGGAVGNELILGVGTLLPKLGLRLLRDFKSFLNVAYSLHIGRYVEPQQTTTAIRHDRFDKLEPCSVVEPQTPRVSRRHPVITCHFGHFPPPVRQRRESVWFLRSRQPEESDVRADRFAARLPDCQRIRRSEPPFACSGTVIASDIVLLRNLLA